VIVENWRGFAPYALGLLYAILFGHWLVKANVDVLWKVIGVGSKVERHDWPSTLLGSLERTLYIASLLIGKGEFIAVWLALKAVPQWQRWNEIIKTESIQIDSAKTEQKQIEGRAVYNIFLIGNALNVLFAAVGWRIVIFLRAGEWVIPLAESMLLIVVCLASFEWSKRKQSRK